MLSLGCGDAENLSDTPIDTGIGSVDGAPEDAGVPPTPPPWNEVEFRPQAPTLPRLTATQYSNSIRTLFGDSIVVPPTPEPDSEVGGFVAIGAAVSTVSPRGVENFEAAAYVVSAQLMTEESRDQVVPCTPSGIDDQECMTALVSLQGRRIWRRPLTDDEIDRIARIGMNAATTLGDFYQGAEFALSALLQSPYFVFRREVGLPDAESPDTSLYTSYEIAARLSFLLLDTTPDDELLNAADAGQLDTDQGLRAEAMRLLSDPRARVGVARFFTEWLHLDGLKKLNKDPQVFPAMSPELGEMARTETLLTLEDLVFERQGDFREILTQRRTFVNRKLASVYAVRAPSRDGFAAVELPEYPGRRGLLGHASVLAGNSHPTSTSATLRGIFVRERLLCAVIPAPPADVDTSIPEPTGRVQTLRDRVAEHLESPSCSGCHLLVDPIGLSLENFDGIGVWRTQDYGGEIDPSGDFDGAPFADAAELAQRLHDDPRFAACVVRQIFRYSMARSEELEDLSFIAALEARFIAGEYRFLDLLMELIVSPAFRRVSPIETEAQ